MANKRRYWLFKTEPNVYSIQDLSKDKGKRTSWEGVRNYQVRNMLRDDIKVGDGVLVYHSRVDPMAIAGTAEVVKDGYPDHFAFDENHKYYDPRCDPENPRWYMVDVKLLQIFETPVTREQLKRDKVAAEMIVMSKGSRLSITEVTEKEWLVVHKLAGAEPG
jgi:predicted RNA-binding protein with PUA-like domain